MGFIRAGFTGGFLGIVISIANIFVNSKVLENLSSVGLYLANFFGKACIDNSINECGLFEKFLTIIATIVGNTIAYFVIFALISMAISIIKMWFTVPKTTEQVQTQQPQIIAQQQPEIQQQTQQATQKEQEQQAQPIIQETSKPKKEAKEKRPRRKAKVRKSDKN
jgi:hypothetical protein